METCPTPVFIHLFSLQILIRCTCYTSTQDCTRRKQTWIGQFFPCSWELGKDGEEKDIIDMEGLACRVKRENNIFEGLLSIRHGSTCCTYLNI